MLTTFYIERAQTWLNTQYRKAVSHTVGIMLLKGSSPLKIHPTSDQSVNYFQQGSYQLQRTSNNSTIFSNQFSPID